MDSSTSPAPQVLKPQEESAPEQPAAAEQKPPLKPRHAAYRPSHRATFIALIVVVAILAINAGVIGFIIVKGQAKDKPLAQGQVVISPSELSKLGVNQTPVGDSGLQLQVNPDAKFNGKVDVAGNVNIAGQLQLNNDFTAPGGRFGNLQAGATTLNSLDVNGAGTFTTLNVRTELDSNGIARFIGATTFSNLVTFNSSINVSGDLSVGGTLAINTLHISSLVVDTSATLGGHILTRGNPPGVSAGGSALGSNGTVGISGNDQAGTVSANIGVGATKGVLANVTFHMAYATTPRIVVTGVGAGMGSLYITSVSASGFSIGTDNTLSPGGYTIDYIVAQ